eukprot:COSAG02_NODE_8746_length_2457_cov_1.119593_3_plen_100_part_01
MQADALARELAGDGSANTLNSGSAGTDGVDGGSVASEAAEDAVASRRMEQIQGIVSASFGVSPLSEVPVACCACDSTLSDSIFCNRCFTNSCKTRVLRRY